MPTSGCISKSSLLNFESDFQQTIPLSSRSKNSFFSFIAGKIM